MEKNRTSRKKKTSAGSSFIIQGSILAIAGIIVRLIGMLYRIPLARIIGDVGNGYYNSAYTVYNILLIVSSYSLPTAVSKMVATKIAKKEYINSVRILRAALFYAALVGGVGAAVMWFGADFFANHFLNLPFTKYALMTLAPTIWIMAFLGVFRGYFQGLGTMVPTALSQIFEQIVNAIISIVAAYKLFELGKISNLVYGAKNYSFAFGASGGTIGTGAGALTALVFVMFLMLNYRPIMRRQARRDRSRRIDSYKRISGVLFLTVMPIVISSAIYNVSSVLDNGIFGNGMAYFGSSEKEIASMWGIYLGKYHLLFNIPVAIANSLAASLIPSLSRAVTSKNRGQVIDRVSMVIRFSMVIAIPATVGLTVLAGPISNLLFRGMDNTMMIQMTTTGSLAVVFFSLSTVTNAVLQGINHLQTPIRNAVVSLILHIIILVVMMFGFKMGIYSVVYSNILFALFMCLLNGFSISRYLNYRQEMLKTFLLPTVASAVMGAAALGTYKLSYLAVRSNLIGTLLAILVAIIVYGILFLKLRCVDEVELYGMPGGAGIVRVAHKLHLM